MSKEVSTITLRMTPEEKFEIEKAAAKSKRSVNKFIIYTIQESIRNEKK